MKSLKIGLAALALAVGFGSSAFKAAKSATDVQYNWFTPAGSFVQFSSLPPSDCTGGTVPCAQGYENTVKDETQPAGEPDQTVRKLH